MYRASISVNSLLKTYSNINEINFNIGMQIKTYIKYSCTLYLWITSHSVGNKLTF